MGVNVLIRVMSVNDLIRVMGDAKQHTCLYP